MGVAATDKMAEFSDALSVTTRRVMRWPVLLPTLLVFLAPALLGAGIVGRLMWLLQERSLAEVALWSQRNQGSIVLVAFLALALAPAAVSGFAAMANAVSQTDESVSGWAPFWKGLGKYYWRIVGAYAALIAIAVVGGILIAVFVGPFSYPPPSDSGLLRPFLLVAVTMGTYFFGPWIAVAVVEDTGFIASALRSAKFAWKNPHVLAPAFVIQAVLSRIAERLSNLGVTDAISRSRFTLPRGWFIGAVLGAVLSGVVYVYFLVFRIYAYRRSVTPPPQPLPELLAESLPGSLPETPPVSDEDQVAEDKDDRGEDDKSVPPVAL